MKKYLLILIIQFWALSCIEAQDKSNIINQKEEDVYSQLQLPLYHDQQNVNPSGMISFNIPIWNIRSGELTIPFSLNYASKGITENSDFGRLSCGWTLSYGVSLSQNVIGGDDLRYIFNYGKSIKYNEKNTEYDIFTLKINGRNIRFVFNLINDDVNNIKYFFLSEEHVKVKMFFENDNLSSFSKMEVTDFDGTKYVFIEGMIYEKVAVSDKYIVSKNKNFVLKEIISANNIDKIQFHYNNQTECRFAHGIYISDMINYYGYYNEKEYYKSSNNIHLLKITTKNETIEIQLEENRDAPNQYMPVPHNPQVFQDSLITKINILNNSEDIIKTLKFEYNSKATLKSLQVTNNEGEFLPPYEFKYISHYSVNKGKDIDFWGYYKVLPDYPNELYANYSMRFPDNFSGQRGLLRSVLYPTGKKIYYTYEPNTYSMPENGAWYDENWDATLKNIGYCNMNHLVGPGYRIKKITTHSENSKETIEYDYNMTEGEGIVSSGKLSYYPFFSYEYFSGSKRNVSSNIVSLGLGSVYYEKITKYIGGKNDDSSGVNGKIESFYTIHAPEENEVNNLPYPLKVFQNETNGLLRKKVIYNKDNKKVKEFYNGYEFGIKNSTTPCFRKTLFPWHLTGEYHLNQVNNNVVSNTLINYNSQEETTLIKEDFISYNRNDVIYSKPIHTITTDSKGDVIKTVYKYPQDFAGIEVYDLMVERNMLTTVIEKLIYKNDIFVSGTKTNYRLELFNQGTTDEIKLVVADNESTITKHADEFIYNSYLWYDKYNPDGKLLEFHGKDGIHNCIVYGYKNTLPVASVINSSNTEIEAFLTDADKTILNAPASDQELNAVITKLRNGLSNAVVTGTTYKPLVGKTTETDANGRMIKYEYDNFNRLISVKNHDNNILTQYEHNTKSIQEETPSISYTFYTIQQENENYSLFVKIFQDENNIIDQIYWKCYDDAGNLIANVKNTANIGETQIIATVDKPTTSTYYTLNSCVPNKKEYDRFNYTLIEINESTLGAHDIEFPIMIHGEKNYEYTQFYTSECNNTPEITIYENTNWLSYEQEGNKIHFYCDHENVPGELSTTVFVNGYPIKITRQELNKK